MYTLNKLPFFHFRAFYNNLNIGQKYKLNPNICNRSFNLCDNVIRHGVEQFFNILITFIPVEDNNSFYFSGILFPLPKTSLISRFYKFSIGFKSGNIDG